MWTHYDNLKVARNAPPAVIKAAYRALSQQYHPDRNPAPDAQRIMRLINEAYDVLGDPTRRAEYDRELDAQEQEAKLAAQRKAAARKDDDSTATHAPRRAPQTPPPPRPAPPPPPTQSTAARSASPPVWARVLLCAVLFAIGVWLTWREELNTTATRDAPDVANTASPWVTPSPAPSPEVAAPASGASGPLPVERAVDRAPVPPATSPVPVPAAANPAPIQPAPAHIPAQPLTRPPVRPAPTQSAPTQSAPPWSTPTVSDTDFIAMIKVQVPDFERIIHDPDWDTYLRWHEGATTIAQIATNAFTHRDLKTSVKIFETFKLAKNTAVSGGIPFPKLMEYEDQLIKKLPGHDTR